MAALITVDRLLCYILVMCFVAYAYLYGCHSLETALYSCVSQSLEKICTVNLSYVTEIVCSCSTVVA